MGKSIKNQKLVDVWEDTKEIFEGKSLKSQGYVLEPKTERYDSYDIMEYEITTSTVEVLNSDSVSCLIDEDHFAGKICILNMASAKNAGGGVARGTKSQEEDLFRCSNLHLTLDQKEYPLGEDEAFYSEDVMFIKDSEYKRLKIPVICDVVTIPAVNLNKNSYYDENLKEWISKVEDKPLEYEDTMLNKIRLMLTLAIENHCDTIILGAWGCGVFKNHPKEVAEFFKKVLNEENYGVKFERIVFAVIDDKNSVDSNYDIFYKTFR
jgi:uncharacterized protein (TIGR02452 family)